MNPTLGESEYYHSQGLERDPFPIDAADDIYFVTPEIRHRLDLIKHLLEFSNQLLVIIAPRGSGKSALYRHIASSGDSNWLISRIDAEAGMGPLDLALKIIRESVPDRSRHSSESIKGLNKYLESCHRDQKLPVVLIDDAHLLSVDTLEYITKLLDLKHEVTRLRIVLFAEGSIVKKLDDPMIKAGSSGILHTIDIQPLSPEQTGDYLQHRFYACGEHAKSPFTNKDFRQIYRVSGGIPGKINHLARQVLQDPAVFKDSGNKSFTGKTLPMIAGIVVVLIIAAFLISGERRKPEDTGEISLTLPEPAGKPALSEQEPVVTEVPSTSEQEQAGTEEPSTTDEPVVEITAGEEAELEKELLPLVNGEAEPVDVEILIPDLEPRQEGRREPGEDQETVPAGVPAGAAEAVETTAPATEAPVAAAGTGESTGTEKRVIPGVKGEEWLRRQSPEHYVLQLIGANDRNTLLKLLQDQALDRDKLAAFTTYNKGKEWYVLVYGLYPDRNTALTAIPSLPEKIRAQKPWGRSIGSIQSAIKTAP